MKYSHFNIPVLFIALTFISINFKLLNMKKNII